jgi:hypothetical protein
VKRTPWSGGNFEKLIVAQLVKKLYGTLQFSYLEPITIEDPFSIILTPTLRAEKVYFNWYNN